MNIIFLLLLLYYITVINGTEEKKNGTPSEELMKKIIKETWNAAINEMYSFMFVNLWISVIFILENVENVPLPVTTENGEISDFMIKWNLQSLQQIAINSYDESNFWDKL